MKEFTVKFYGIGTIKADPYEKAEEKCWSWTFENAEYEILELNQQKLMKPVEFRDLITNLIHEYGYDKVKTTTDSIFELYKEITKRKED